MRALFLLLIAACVTACSPTPKVNANMTDAVLQERLSAEIHHGMTREGVNSGLNALNVSEDWRLWYERTDERPPVQFVRLFPPGGFWPGNQSGFISWVDLSFVFDDGVTLSRTVLFRDGVRYVGDLPLNPPTRAPVRPFQPFPAPPPPPLDPLAGGTSF